MGFMVGEKQFDVQFLDKLCKRTTKAILVMAHSEVPSRSSDHSDCVALVQSPPVSQSVLSTVSFPIPHFIK